MTDLKTLSNTVLYGITAVIGVLSFFALDSGATLSGILTEITNTRPSAFIRIFLPALLIGVIWHSAEQFHIHRLQRVVMGVMIACGSGFVEYYLWPHSGGNPYTTLETVLVVNMLLIAIPAILVCLILDWLRKPIRISPDADPFHGGVE